jgi:hypothetical protein
MIKDDSVIGKRFFKLIAIERLQSGKLNCLCDCGNYRQVRVGHFNSGTIKSCGCHVIRHGLTKSKEYVSWSNMIARCHNKTNKRYKDYGEKGIIVCEKWKNSFLSFFNDMGNCPEGYQIDRIDNNGIYEKDNCKWSSPKENMANRSISNIFVINGKRYNSSMDAAIDLNVSTSTITAWCKGRKSHDYLCRKKSKVIREYKNKPGCYLIPVYK